jgi:hypothetical protein
MDFPPRGWKSTGPILCTRYRRERRLDIRSSCEDAARPQFLESTEFPLLNQCKEF